MAYRLLPVANVTAYRHQQGATPRRWRALAAPLALWWGLLAGCDGDSRGPTEPPPPGPPPGGECQGYPDWETSLYVLPYPVGQTHVVVQGNCDPPGTHTGSGRYSYDFGAPIGSTVTAIRSGTVIKATDDNGNHNKRAGDGDGRDDGESNVIQIQHADGTVAFYIHLDRDGALVTVGELVHAGDVIARSGASGLTPLTQPHLHLDVRMGDVTVPLTFRNTDPNPNGLGEGFSYTALPFTPDDR